ncbi:MAG TPA: class I SAM-dependent methyltransferase, partial [Acidimicrobiales bacterium]
ELFGSKEFRYLGRAQSMTHYRREPLGAGERRRNALRQCAQLPYFARNVLIKALILGKLGFVAQKAFGHDPATWPH